MSNHEGHHEVASEHWEAEENAASIRGIPRDQLWDDEARVELMRRALAGRMSMRIRASRYLPMSLRRKRKSWYHSTSCGCANLTLQLSRDLSR